MEYKIEFIKIEDLHPYEKNAKIHDEEQIQRIARSIEEFGFKQNLVIDEDNTIIIGHGRLEAAKRLGMVELPCIRAKDLTPEQIKALRLADNKVAESGWNEELLLQELQEIGELDMEAFGFISTAAADENITVNEVEMPSIPDDPKAQEGDIYRLGDHILICGDSTKRETIEALMGGEIADLIVTDPPYNVAYEGRTKEKLTIKNDKMSEANFINFLTDAFQAVAPSLKAGGAFYIWHSSSAQMQFEQAMRNVGWKPRQQLIWNKNTMILGRQDYQWKHEPCFYGWADGAAHYFVDDRKQTTVFEDMRPNIKAMKKEELQELLEELLGDKVSTTVIYEDKPAASEIHPTMKPIRLLARQIKNSSKPGEIVVDIFGGSGSTLIACEQLGRKCRTVELDPRYTDAIIERWETFTGKKAELIKSSHMTQ